MAALFVGLMSGTSLDGVDAVLASFPGQPAVQVLGHHHRPMPEDLRRELLALNRSGPDELHRAALAANALATLYAEATHALLADTGHSPAAVRALGAHGQTVRHRPGEFDGIGYTLQLFNGALLAERCGIDVVCDFRSRDLSAGGQGAPLVPAFHAACFGQPGQTLAVLNLGGIANLSLLGADGRIGGFDCGPGNALLDLWCQRHCGTDFDDDGGWAAGGTVVPGLLRQWLADPYFQRPPPKSTGRDLFNAAWLDASLDAWPALDPQDVQATLAELTACATADALRQHASPARLLVCGGGAYNGHLMRRLSARLPAVELRSSDTVGLPPLQVEAAAFAWLAQAHLAGLPGNRPEVTGARGLRVLGALYPAG